ncbi:hypothetical protein ABPG75_004119 [Micractinium tetrahymenae]
MAFPRALWTPLFALLAFAACATRGIITAFRDAKLARPGQVNWTKALASWTCPTDASNSDSSCDPCGREVWGNWEHMACRGRRVAHDKYELPGSGQITNIHITDYSIEGAVPLAELCPLKSLREFDVDGGKLTGPIPAGFAQCFPELIELDLSYNSLTGTLPREIADNKNLEQFKVEHNQLVGSIPPEYGAMPALSWLRLADNGFVGTIPASFSSSAPRLYQLQLDGNDFSGSLYPLTKHSLVNVGTDSNPKLCGMVPVGVRFVHGFNPYQTRLGLPCSEELAGGWTDLSESLP